LKTISQLDQTAPLKNHINAHLIFVAAHYKHAQATLEGDVSAVNSALVVVGFHMSPSQFFLIVINYNPTANL